MTELYTLHPKAIPTEYNGVTYRSRLEARWAVFFDALELRFIHEREGFQLRSAWYVPDFWLPKLSTWIEIKPYRPSDPERMLCEELCESTEQRVACFYADPGSWLDDLESNDPGFDSGIIWKPGGETFTSAWWCICPQCSRIGIEYLGRGNRICRHVDTKVESIDRMQTHDASFIRKAADAARAFKFWDPTEAV